MDALENDQINIHEFHMYLCSEFMFKTIVVMQCESMGAVEKKLKEMEIKHVRARVEEGGIYVDQLFFHDPDGFMIEICNCDNLPVIPIGGELVRSCSIVKFELLQQQQQTPSPVIQQ